MRVKLHEKFEKIEQGFSLFDSEKSGRINDKDLLKLLKHIGLQVKENDLELVLNRFDRDTDGMFSKEQFLKELRPKISINNYK